MRRLGEGAGASGGVWGWLAAKAAPKGCAGATAKPACAGRRWWSPEATRTGLWFPLPSQGRGSGGEGSLPSGANIALRLLMRYTILLASAFG